MSKAVTLPPVVRFFFAVRLFILLLCASAIALPARAVEELADEPRAIVRLDAAELHYLNDRSPLPQLFLEITDETGERSLVFNLGNEMRESGEEFDPQTGAFVGSTIGYRNPGQLEFVLPEDFTPADYRIYSENGLQEQEPVNFRVDFVAPGMPVTGIHAALDGESTLNIISKTGPATNRIDFVLVGDGYTRAESARWQADAQRIIDNFFSQQPYAAYRSFFNMYRVDAFSTESGADHPQDGTYRDTAFDASYDCLAVGRGLCASNSKVRQELNKHLDYNSQDIVLVIVNDPTYGGSGGEISVISTTFEAVELAHHEIGHDFGWLADEYVDTAVKPPSQCYPNVEPSAPNASMVHYVREEVKWAHWINSSVVVPSAPTTTGDTPGLYPGGALCENLYRPTPNSKMRTLGRPYDQVNEEQLVLRMYDYVNLLESVSPATSTVFVPNGAATPFTFQAVRPTSGVLYNAWYLDGVQVGQGPVFTADVFPPGRHTLELVIQETTPKVLSPRDKPRLSDRMVWNVSKGDEAAYVNPLLTIPVVRAANGQAYQASLRLISSNPMTFVLQTLDPVSAVPSATEASYVNGIATLPEVAVGAYRYSARLEFLPGTSPMRLRVIETALLGPR